MAKAGLWFIGARGGVGTTAITGLIALQRNLIKPAGLTTELPIFSNADFSPWTDWIIGGHEIRQKPLFDCAVEFASTSRAYPLDLLEKCSAELQKIDQNIAPGTIRSGGDKVASFAEIGYSLNLKGDWETIQRIQLDWNSFKARHSLDRMIVINVASTEPVWNASIPSSWDALRDSLNSTKGVLPTSSLYAVAALDAGIPYVNFTPSLGSDFNAARELALERSVCHAGRDGKTGETLLKSTLAPMFADRNLEIMSWVGHNIIGNMDGRVLDDPRNKAAKIGSKDRLVGEIMGYQPQTLVSIEYVESLGDWKTAWDHIHFRGFMGTPMTMQFTWQGCDSLLAAPLVLDLARLTELASRRGSSGELEWLAGFFKSPQGTSQHRFAEQFRMLRDWLDGQSR